MRILLKDYSTEKKSFTVTILVLGIIATLVVVSFGILKMIEGTLTTEDNLLIGQTLMFLGYGIALYWRKRKFQIGPSGLSVEEENNGDN